jgi:hypothetical protein
MRRLFTLLLKSASEYGIIYILAARVGRPLDNFRFGGIIMATEAQTSANRSNAQKSTGPRTPQGRAVVAQNAVKHGLLTQEVVIKGEDPGAFALYREGMLEELAPAGPMESMVAERIAGLAWRLRRAERLQGAAFDTLGEDKKPAKPIWSDEAKGWIVPRPAQLGPDEQARRIVQDFGEARIFDRLLIYERRIEHSLYRTMAELRNLRKEKGVSSLKLENPASSSPGLPTSHSPLPTSGGTTNGPEAESQLCETNPIYGSARGTGILPVNPDYEHGQDAHATGTPDGVTTNVSEAEGQLCETNPIGTAPTVEAPHHSTIPCFQDSNPRPETWGQSCETNPICVGPDEDRVPGREKEEEVGRGRPTYEESPDASMSAGLRQTKPIGGLDERQVLCGQEVTRNLPQGGVGETKPKGASYRMVHCVGRPAVRS